MSFYNNKPNKTNNTTQSKKIECNCKEIPYLDDLNDYDKVKKFLSGMENFTSNCIGRLSYTKIRKYYDKILKVLEKEKNDINKLKSFLNLEVKILIEYDIGRSSGDEKKVLACLKEFFDKTLDLLDKEDGRKLFEKNWETLIAYAKKNLKN